MAGAPWTEQELALLKSDLSETAIAALTGRTLKAVRGRRTKERLMNSKSIPHGTLNGYNNYRCRCLWCNEAARAYERSRPKRARKG